MICETKSLSKLLKRVTHSYIAWGV